MIVSALKGRSCSKLEYYLVDLERTVIYMKPYFWKRGNHGYTTDHEEAQTFTKRKATLIAKSDVNKRTIPISAEAVRMILLEDHKTYGRA